MSELIADTRSSISRTSGWRPSCRKRSASRDACNFSCTRATTDPTDDHHPFRSRGTAPRLESDAPGAGPCALPYGIFTAHGRLPSAHHKRHSDPATCPRGDIVVAVARSASYISLSFHIVIVTL